MEAGGETRPVRAAQPLSGEISLPRPKRLVRETSYLIDMRKIAEERVLAERDRDVHCRGAVVQAPRRSMRQVLRNVNVEG